MALTKPRRFILVQSKRNAHVTDDNMEPYHVSTFRRSASMPPLPRLTSAVDSRPSPATSSHCQRDEASNKKAHIFSIHTMKKKSARLSMRLNGVFGLSTRTIDERFNYEEQRFRAMEKFVRVFLRHVSLAMEVLREAFIAQVGIVEDFRELLIDQMPDLVHSCYQSRSSSTEKALAAFFTHMESHVVNPLNTLVKFFVSPSNLITKRHNKLLDYDSSQSAYEKVKHQQLKKAKQLLDLSKRTYELLNNQLVDELPLLYQHSYQILSMCLHAFILGHVHLMRQMQTNIRLVFAQRIMSTNPEQLHWTQILDRFTDRSYLTSECLFQLAITAKKSHNRLSLLISQASVGDQDAAIQTEEMRQTIRRHYPAKDLFTVVQHEPDRTSVSHRESRLTLRAQTGDLVGIVDRADSHAVHWLVDNGITHGYLPRAALAPLVLDDASNDRTLPPPVPPRHDKAAVHNASHLPGENYDQPRDEVPRAHSERIYFNQIQDVADEPPSIQPEENKRIYVALYDFECTIDGVLSLHIGEQVKLLRRIDDDGNAEWWYVEKLNDRKQRGYVPANYVQLA